MGHSTRSIRHAAPVLVVTAVLATGGCAQTGSPPTAPAPAAATVAAPVQPLTSSFAQSPPESDSAQPQLASDPALLADELVGDEQALRDPSASDGVLTAAARRQQVAYRLLARHPEWDSITHPRIPSPLVEVFDRNIDARRQLGAMGTGQSMLPAWRIDPPTPADELLDYYREAEAASGVGWNYLAAINLIETGFGRVAGVSTAGAQGPMQFLPSTFATHGADGDIQSPHDSIMAAGRYLAANGFGGNRDNALYRYNNSHQYVAAVNDYAAAMAADPAAFAGYYRWDVYYVTTAGDVLLPIGYSQSAPMPVADYLATHPQ
jgi:soluble lytic murein transglycosylase-like protein